jgi:hypothetical protein
VHNIHMPNKSLTTETAKNPPCSTVTDAVETVLDLSSYKLSPKLLRLTSNRSTAEALLKQAGILDSTGQLSVHYAR